MAKPSNVPTARISNHVHHLHDQNSYDVESSIKINNSNFEKQKEILTEPNKTMKIKKLTDQDAKIMGL